MEPPCERAGNLAVDRPFLPVNHGRRARGRVCETTPAGVVRQRNLTHFAKVSPPCSTMRGMDAHQLGLLKACDPTEIGGRLRALRLSKSLTQTDVAGDILSVAYLSRMESGQRRPTAKVLSQLAERLGVSVEELLGETTPREMDEIRLTLDYAELSLESGEAHEALTHVREALARLEDTPADPIVDRARFLGARAHEALGSTDEALDELEALAASSKVSGL